MIQNHTQYLKEKFDIKNQIACQGRTLLSVANFKNDSKEDIIVKECMHSMIGNNCSSACNQLHNEYKIASDIDHPNITKPISFEKQYKGGCMMAMPKAECDAFDFFTNKENKITVNDIKNYIRSMATSLDHLHNKQNIVHNDFKLENVLLFKSQQGELIFQLSDFGFSYSLEDNGDKQSFLKSNGSAWKSRSVDYFSPKICQLLQSKQPIEQCEKQGDIFSFGYSIFALLYKRRFCQQADKPCMQSQLYESIQKHGKKFITFKLKSTVDLTECELDQVLDLMLKMIVQDDEMRITASEILQHPFIAQ